MSRITVHKNGTVSEFGFVSGENLLELLRRNGCSIAAPCGGHGLCGKCRVVLRRAEQEQEVSACSCTLTESCEVFLPADDSDISWNGALGAHSAETDREGFGAAVDLGTTTVALSLYELRSGRELGSISRWNAQRAYGADVISRIGYCSENADGLKRLGREIREQILEMLRELCVKNALSPHDVSEGFLAGNTAMEHIFAGISPASIAAAPYRPECFFDSGESVTLGGVPFLLSPCVAGYVGGDITAGLLASAITETDRNALFIDVGTNGEIALYGKSGLVSCAVASGPAFEGAGVCCGMPAQSGAVSSVTLEDDSLCFEVIGGGEAEGICGSGLLDLTACLLKLGYIDESGCLETVDGGDAFFLTDKVYINQRDIRALQLAKAAVSAGITRLLETEGMRPDDIDVLYLSGGFGTRLNSKSAVRIGMLPRALSGRIVPLGNTSLSGAAEALLNPSKRQKLAALRAQCRYLELSSDPEFNDRFVDAMSFPEQ